MNSLYPYSRLCILFLLPPPPVHINEVLLQCQIAKFSWQNAAQHAFIQCLYIWLDGMLLSSRHHAFPEQPCCWVCFLCQMLSATAAGISLHSWSLFHTLGEILCVTNVATTAVGCLPESLSFSLCFISSTEQSSQVPTSFR